MAPVTHEPLQKTKVQRYLLFIDSSDNLFSLQRVPRAFTSIILWYPVAL